MTVHDGTVDGMVQNRKKAQEWHFDPRCTVDAFPLTVWMVDTVISETPSF